MKIDHPLFPNPQLKQNTTVLLLGLPFLGTEIPTKPLTGGTALKQHSVSAEKVELDVEAMKLFFQSHGINAKKAALRLSEEFETNAQDFIHHELEQAFKTEHNKIVYISAPIDKNSGALIINNHHKKGQLQFEGFYSLWQKKRQGHLLLILESDHALLWVNKLKQKNDFSLSILASSMKTQNLKRVDKTGASVFTQQMIKLFKEQTPLQEIFENISPQFYGIPHVIYHKYGYPFFLADQNYLNKLAINDQIPTVERDLGNNIIYKGQLIDDQMTGYGELFQEENQIYLGFFKDGQQHGYGISISKENKYHGFWQNGQKQGLGYLLSGDEEFYGRFQSGFIERGIQQSKTSEYSGEFKNFQKHGKGEQVFQDGQTYTGDFVNDKKHGRGKFFYQSKSVNHSFVSYEGDFYEDQMDGYGGLVEGQMNKISLQYEGEMKNNMKHGFGSLTSPKKWSYHGLWVWDKREGNGVFLRNQDRFLGYFEEGKATGKWTDRSGQTTDYDGPFDDQFN